MKNTYHPIKKLATGVFLLASFYFLFTKLDGTDGITAMERSIKNYLVPSVSESAANGISALLCLPITIFMLYAFVSGLYRICTFNVNNPVFDNPPKGGVSVKGHGLYPEINRVLSYRESKLASMSPERAAELYINTSKIESLYSGYTSGPETDRVLSFIESKLCGMSSDKALNYLNSKL